METLNENVPGMIEKSKRTWLKVFLNFMLFGGWIVVIGVGIATAIVLDMYVF